MDCDAVPPKANEQVVEVSVGDNAVSEGSAQSDSSDEDGNVYEEDVERPEKPYGLGSLQISWISESEDPRDSSEDETEGVYDVLVSEIGKLQSGFVEKIVTSSSIRGLTRSVCAAEGD